MHGAGSFALNPATGQRVPVWVAEYVLGSYGSGAIMAVPAHDTRDYDFAQQYGLPIAQVVQGLEGEAEQQIPFTGEDAPPQPCTSLCPVHGHRPVPSHAAETQLPSGSRKVRTTRVRAVAKCVPSCPGKGVAVSSSNEAEGLELDGLGTEEAAAAAVRWLQERGRGGSQTNYKLRDWLFARQRYWGEPFPIVFEEGSDVSVPVPLHTISLVAIGCHIRQDFAAP